MRNHLKIIGFIAAALCGNIVYGADAEPEQELVNKRYCLSIDGGGLRGTFPAVIVRQVESDTRSSVSSLFKAGITGTSTGALIALGVAARKSLDASCEDFNKPLLTGAELVDFYKNHAQGIFKCWTPANCWHNVADCSNGSLSCVGQSICNVFTCCGCFACYYNCGGICGAQYSNKYLREELEKVFGDRKLKDVVVPVQVVTYDITNNTPLYLNSIDHGEVLMVDAALASSAAPTFFPPYKFEIPQENGVHYRCIDGGVYDNNPVLAALRFSVEIYRHTDHEEADIRHFKLVSIGTGATPTVTNFGGLIKAGKLGWASTVIQTGMDGTSATSHQSMESIFGRRKDGKHYYRFQPILPEQYSAMDNPKVVEYLCRIGIDMKKEAEYVSLINELNQHRMLIPTEVAEVNQEDFDVAAQYLRRRQGAPVPVSPMQYMQ